MFVKLWPVKKVTTRLRIKKAAIEITKPTIAAIMLERAAAIFALSPPDVIQRIPPKIRKNTDAMIAIRSRTCTTAPTTPPPFSSRSLQSPLKLLPAAAQISWAYAGVAAAKRRGIPVRKVAIEAIFFTLYS